MPRRGWVCMIFIAASCKAASEPARAAGGRRETIAIGPDNARIAFVGSKVTGSNRGQFDRFSGTIELIDGSPGASRVSVDLDMTSVSTDAAELTKHLKTADFFDVAQYPSAHFRSTKILTGEGEGHYEVAGNLELHGVTRWMRFPATIEVDSTSITVASEFSMNRHDFGVDHPGTADDPIRDLVLIQLSVHAKR